MIIQCSSCGTKFRFDESKLTGSGAKLKCSKCKNVFVVKKSETATSEPQTDTSQPAPEQPRSENCPFCHKPVNHNTHFCPHCGEDINRKPPPQKEETLNTCPSCRHNNLTESRFCMECGAALQKPVRVEAETSANIQCPQCGSDNPAESKFCLDCGTKFSKSAASDEPTLSEKMKKMYADQGLDEQSDDAGGTLFPFTSGWGDDCSGETVKRKGEDIKLILTLRVVKGSDEGKEYTITKKRTIIGRADADIIIDDFKTSRNHAEIEMLGHKFLIKDLESTNGTFLNDEMTPADFLSHEDTLGIGDTVYQVIIEEERFV